MVSKSGARDIILSQIKQDFVTPANAIFDYLDIVEKALSKLDDALPLKRLSAKFKSFNCNCINIKNGHSFTEIINGFKKIKLFKNSSPTVLIVNTVKGKGIREFENDPIWHARQVTKEDILIAKKSLKF